MNNGNPYSQFEVHNSPITSLACTPSGRIVLTGHQDGKIKLMNLDYSGQNKAEQPSDTEISVILKETISEASKKITSVNINIYNDFNQILLSSANQLVQYDFAKIQVVRRIVDETPWRVYNACSFLNSDLVASVDNGTSLRLFDLKARSNKPVQVFLDAEDSLTCLDFKKQRNWLVTCGSSDGGIYTYDLRMGNVAMDSLQVFDKQHQKKIVNPVTSVFLSECADNTNLFSQSAAVGALNSDVRLVNLNLQSAVAESSNFVTGYNEHAIENTQLGLTENQTYSKPFPEKNYQVDTKLVSNDAFIISGSETGEVYIWSTKGKKTKVLKTYNSYMTTENSQNKLLGRISYLNSIKCMLAAGGDGKVHIWENIYI